MKHLVLIFIVGLSALQFGNAQSHAGPNDVKVTNTVKDTAKKSNHKYILPFADSMRTDTLLSILAGRFQIHAPELKRGRIRDPFDPFLRETYIRRGLGKFWFFIVTLLIIGLLLYYRNAFPNQLILRFRSLLSSYHFRELLSDFGLSFTSGSAVAGGIATLIQAQGIILIVVYSGYYSLNSSLFYIMVVLGLVIWRVFMFFLQSVQAYVLELTNLGRSQVQRQLNVNLAVSLILFPLIVFAYFNSSLLHGINVALIVAIAITAGISIRLIMEFLGLFQESGFSLSGILYFCAFEILPHAILFSALFRRYST